MKLDDTFSFGKHAGKTPRELLRKGKGLYLMFCLANINSFHIEPMELECAIRERYAKQYIRIKSKTQPKKVVR
jgi:hypothetical protein